MTSKVYDAERTLASAATIYLSDGNNPTVMVTSAIWRVTALGGGTYIKIGDYVSQNHVMRAIDDFFARDARKGKNGEDIPFNLNDYALLTDGTNATLSISAVMV